jgi:hypothetical protein
MSQTPKKKTKQDLFLRLLEEIGGKHGAFLRERFKQEVMPNLSRGPAWEHELTDEEFESQFQKMKKELPAFIHFLESRDFPKPPDSWTARQN